MEKKKVYVIKGIHWRERTLLYPDYEPVIEIVNELSTLLKAEDQNFLVVAQQILKRGYLPHIMPIIIELDNRGYRLIINWIQRKIFGIDTANIINYMSEDEWKPVLADFFIKSSQWMMNWLPIASDLGSQILSKTSPSPDASSKKENQNSSTIKPVPNSSSTSAPTADSPISGSSVKPIT